jgi:hypothetical protein
MVRDGLGKVRHGFRTRERGDLPTGTCGQCKGETYRVPAGTWLHWVSLGVDCPGSLSNGQEGAISVSGDSTTGRVGE